METTEAERASHKTLHLIPAELKINWTYWFFPVVSYAYYILYFVGFRSLFGLQKCADSSL